MDKHFLTDPSSIALASLQGLCAVNPRVALDSRNKVVYVPQHDRSHVALLCGGGSGHEPAHAGFVGDGMLTAAICGNVFASPSASQVRRAIDLVDNDKGTLIIVKNYTGDVLNFGLAREQYATAYPEKSDKIKFLIVGDDVAVPSSQSGIVGRRGLAGTVLVYKIAGSSAKSGADLDEVFTLAHWVSKNIGTVGVGLETCHVPGTAASESRLAVDEIEIGLGIHGEPGNRRLSPIPPIKELVAQMFGMLTLNPERSFLPFRGDGEDNVVLLVNNLGGTSELEMGGIVAQTCRSLEEMKISVKRILSGTFMTSLNMPGFSITLLLLPRPTDVHCPCSAEHLLSLLDEDTNAPGWKWSSRTPLVTHSTVPYVPTTAAQHVPISNLSFPDPKQFTESIERACQALIAAEPQITRYDSIAGDADCGLTLKAGASGVLRKLNDGTVCGTDVVRTMVTIASVAEEQMGGTSGALYSIFFTALAQALQQAAPNELATKSVWVNALHFSLAKLYTYTRARPPSRTLIDPLSAFIETLPQGFDDAVVAAGHAAEETKNMAPKAGRSVYVDVERLRRECVPDPGAWGVKVLLENL